MERPTRAPQGVEPSVPSEPGLPVRLRGEGQRGVRRTVGRAVGSTALTRAQHRAARVVGARRPHTAPPDPAAHADPAGVGRQP
ncbi:hypothetical protein [Streptomyces sp. NPDC053048]|uniref:hypothetical protein n=1 Tax=Streptomyces sp. NPDC053048 TaxID=3365694 RepID=UPI0037CEE872